MYRLIRATAGLGRKIAAIALSAALATGVTVIQSATLASADPLPLTFQIRSVYYGQCAYPQSGAPHYVRMDPCSVGDLSERWFWNPVTEQVTNARVATIGLCLDFEPGFSQLIMTTCDTSVSTQRWNQYTYDGAHYMAQSSGSARVVTARIAGVNWDAYLATIEDRYRQRMTFPLL